MGWQDAPLAGAKSNSKPAWESAPLASPRDEPRQDRPRASDPVPSARQAANTRPVAALRGAYQGLTFNLADELFAGVNALTGNGSDAPTFRQRYENNLAYEREQFRADAAAHPVLDIGGNITGSVVGPGKFVKGASTALGVAKEGAKLGAAYGFGAGEGGVVERGKSAALGAGVGAGAGAAAHKAAPIIGKGINALIPKGATPQAREIADAAARQNVELLPADVGGATTRRVTAAAAQTPLGAGPVVNAAKRSVESVRTARDSLAGASVSDTIGAGEAAQKGARVFQARTGAVGKGLYDRARALTQGATVDATTARAKLDQHIAELAETPNTNAGTIKVLTELKDDLSKPLSVDAIRNLRTQARDKLLSDGIRSNDAERRVSQVLDAASDDLVKSLPPDAARAFKVADRYWRARIQTIDGVLTSVLGKDGEKSGQAAFEAIQRLGNDRGGDADKLRRLIRVLPADELETVRGTIISRLGKANAGAQDASGEAFSPATFLTHYSTMSSRAKDALFGGRGTFLRDGLEDLAKVTSGMREASNYANRSNTGGVAAALATGATIPSPTLLALNLTAQYGAGRLMASPAYVKWLTRTVSAKTPQQYSAQVRALAPIAARYPAIADQVRQVQAGLQATESSASQNRSPQTQGR